MSGLILVKFVLQHGTFGLSTGEGAIGGGRDIDCQHLLWWACCELLDRVNLLWPIVTTNQGPQRQDPSCRLRIFRAIRG